MLDHTHPGFKQALVSLDRLPTRFCNTVFLLYCRDGCSKPEEILAQQVNTWSGSEWVMVDVVAGLRYGYDFYTPPPPELICQQASGVH